MGTQAEHSHCTFCDLIHGAAEVSICHEDADAIAFMDIQPVNNGHVLVVPREHYESVLEVPPEIGMHLFQITMRLANAIRSVTGCEDMNIVVNSGAAAGQDEPHYHVHIIPRREGDGFDIPLPFNGSAMPDRTLLDAYAARIGSALSDPMKDEPGSSGGGRAAGYRQAAPRTRATVSRDDVKRMKHSDAPDRAVALPTYRESEVQRADSPAPVSTQRRAGRWVVEEGPHGELRYEPVAESREEP